MQDAELFTRLLFLTAGRKIQWMTVPQAGWKPPSVLALS